MLVNNLHIRLSTAYSLEVEQRSNCSPRNSHAFGFCYDSQKVPATRATAPVLANAPQTALTFSVLWSFTSSEGKVDDVQTQNLKAPKP